MIEHPTITQIERYGCPRELNEEDWVAYTSKDEEETEEQ